MKKGFLCSKPAVTKDIENNDMRDKEVKKIEDEDSSTTKSLGAIPKTVVVKPTTEPQAPMKHKKRRRTRSRSSFSPSPGRGFFVPGFPEGSKNKSMTLAELMDSSKGLTNMALAHEIAVDKDFSLQKIQPASEVEKQVKEVMQRAFWDLLSEQLTADPPKF